MGRIRPLSSPVAAVAGRVALALLAVVLHAAPALAQPAPGEPLATPAQPEVPVAMTIDPLAPGPAVPARFLGLSFEVAALHQIAGYARDGNLVNLLRSLGPGVLRFGGITADENVGWTDPDTPRPPWATSTIDPADMHALGVLARRSGWQVLLTVGMAHFEPQAAAREVAAAHAALGRHLLAVELGNEPDSYGAHGYRQLPWIAQGYEEQASEYREAIDALTPGVRIAGPDVSGSGAFAEWGEEEALTQKPALLTGHHYPLGCAQKPAPTIEALLSPTIRNLEARSLASYLKVAHANGIPLRIDETNTVSCGGVAGISDTFASALWATSYITQAMAAGAAGINLEGNPTGCSGYTPLCAADPAALAAGQLRPQPEWYALLLTSSLVGSHPLPSSFSVEGSPEVTPNLVAGSFLTPAHAIEVVLVDDEPPGSDPLALHMNLGQAMGAASVLRLTAGSQSATAGVLLGDRAVAANGSWSSRTTVLAGSVASGNLPVSLAPSSVTLISVGPRAAPAAAARRG